LNRKNQANEEKGPKVPAYIVTFSDMTTLLLTFFVMLLSLASIQDEGLFHKGRASFLRSMRQLGLGALYGRKQGPDFGDTKIKYFISRPDESFEGRTIDSKGEGLRRIFKNVSRSMKTMPSQIVGKRSNFSVTNIRFAGGSATLNEPAKRFLSEFCLDLQQAADSKAIKLYVLGLAGDEATEKEQWVLSARRAQAAAEFLQNILAPGTKWSVYSWGAGPGGVWVGQGSPISRESQILIAVLRANE